MSTQTIALGIVGTLLSSSASAGHIKTPLAGFSLSAPHITQLCTDALAATTHAIDAIVALPAKERTLATTFGALDQVEGDLDTILNPAIFLKYVSSDAAIREAAHTCETRYQQFRQVETYSRGDLYAVLADVAATLSHLPEADERLVKKTMRSFEINGLALPPDRRQQVQNWHKRLIELESDYSKHINDDNRFIEVTRDELDGLPADYIERLTRLPNGHYKITMASPDFVPFMQNATSEPARRRLEFAYNNRAYPKNLPILEEALKLRRQVAEALGYPTYADLVLTNRMAKNSHTVAEFLEKLAKKLVPIADKELATLVELKKADDPEATRIHAWDFRYYHNKLLETKYSVDSDYIRHFFPVEHVTQQMFDIYQTLLHVHFKPTPAPYAWDKSVTYYEVIDADSNERIGSFYMDLYPRANKYTHAAAFTLVPGRKMVDGRYQEPVSAIVANFSPPTADAPALLTHDEVETYFHEFGHIMHQVLTRAGYNRMSGTSTAQDYVEVPSQMLENWVWDKTMLKKISKNHKTGEPLPDYVISNIIAAKHLDDALFYCRQLFFGILDQTLHTRDVTDTTPLVATLMEKIARIPMTANTHFHASFGHLMGGYDAAYYSYLWSLVYAQDLFTRFSKEGLLNPKTGADYRRYILSVGGEKDELSQVVSFLGRKANEEAFLKNIGL